MMGRMHMVRNRITSITSLADSDNFPHTLYLRLTPYEKELLEKTVGNDQCLSLSLKHSFPTATSAIAWNVLPELTRPTHRLKSSRACCFFAGEC